MEEWKPVTGYEGLYEVSNLGRVRSVDRVQVTSTCTRRLRGKLLKPRVISGHHKVMLSDKDFKRKDLLVHRLVLEAFRGAAPDNTEACHYDDNGYNNELNNLYWGTRSENTYDQIRNGLHYNAGKTECRRGHPYKGANLRYMQPKKKKNRVCVICQNSSLDRYRLGGEQEDYISKWERSILPLL